MKFPDEMSEAVVVSQNDYLMIGEQGQMPLKIKAETFATADHTHAALEHELSVEHNDRITNDNALLDTILAEKRRSTTEDNNIKAQLKMLLGNLSEENGATYFQRYINYAELVENYGGDIATWLETEKDDFAENGVGSLTVSDDTEISRERLEQLFDDYKVVRWTDGYFYQLDLFKANDYDGHHNFTNCTMMPVTGTFLNPENYRSLKIATYDNVQSVLINEISDECYWVDKDSGKVYVWDGSNSEFIELSEDEKPTLAHKHTANDIVGLSFENCEPILWADLKAKRDAGELVAGKYYRITDYHCTTTQADTMSADHQFDIVVLALDSSTLSENAHAMAHEGDTYFADCNLNAWELKYCLDNDTTRFLWAETRENNEIIGYSNSFGVPKNGNEYFVRQPENDCEINGVLHYCWYCETQECTMYLPEEYPNSDNILCYDTDKLSTNEDFCTRTLYSGRGVIYQMTDEWGNRCPYDFKNILFKRYKVQDESPNGELAELNDKYLGFVGEMNGLSIKEWDFVWCYTFNSDVLESGNEDNQAGYFYDRILSNRDTSLNKNRELGEFAILEENGFQGYRCNEKCYNNTIETMYSYVSVDDGMPISMAILNNIVFLDHVAESKFTSCNAIGNDCHSMTFGYNSQLNKVGEKCSSFITLRKFNYNTFGNYCYSNTFGNYCYSNTFGNDCNYNTFGNNCYSNTFGNDCCSNTFGNYCYSNTFGNDCNYNTFGNDCGSNTFGNDCGSNTFGNRANNVSTPIDKVRCCRFGDYVQNFSLQASGIGYLTNVEVTSGTTNKSVTLQRTNHECNPQKTIVQSVADNIINV